MSLPPFTAPALDEAAIRRLVVAFYGEVREDRLLAPVFDRAIAQGAWPAHLDRMVDFWSSVLLGSGRYRGQPGARHAALPDLSPGHFDRWLEVFKATTEMVLSESEAAQVSALAANMGAGLKRVLFGFETTPS